VVPAVRRVRGAGWLDRPAAVVVEDVTGGEYNRGAVIALSVQEDGVEPGPDLGALAGGEGLRCAAECVAFGHVSRDVERALRVGGLARLVRVALRAQQLEGVFGAVEGARRDANVAFFAAARE